MATLIILTLHILRECHIYIYTIYVHIIAFFSNPITITAHSFQFQIYISWPFSLRQTCFYHFKSTHWNCTAVWNQDILFLIIVCFWNDKTYWFLFISVQIMYTYFNQVSSQHIQFWHVSPFKKDPLKLYCNVE